VSITDRVLDALKTAIQLEERVTSMARSVSELARDVRDIDKRLVRVEAVIEFGTRGGSAGKPPAIEDRSE
jgi:SMC interacting uncharacterized protein involved in chromosome segregation